IEIPKILYHWRSLPTSVASDGGVKSAGFDRAARAVQDALDRRGIAGRVDRPAWAIERRLAIYQLHFPVNGPHVTILIPTRNRADLLHRCVDSILRKTTYKNYSILILDDRSDDPVTLDYLSHLPPRCSAYRIPNESGRFSYAR